MTNHKKISNMRSFKIILLASFLGLLVVGCGIKKMVSRYPEVSVKLADENLENKGGQVTYQVQGTIPPKYMKKKATMTVTPTIEYQGQTIALKPIELQGEKAKATGTKIPYKTGGTFSSSGSFEYKDGYDEANVIAVTHVAQKKKSADPKPDRVLCEGISNSAALMTIHPELSEKAGNGTNLLYAAHNYKPEFITQTEVLYFDLNKSDINMNLKLNKSDKAKDAVKQFGEFLKQGRKIDKVVIAGWASPEGEESLNQGLSDKRSEQGKKWFNDQYDNYLKQYAKDNKLKYKDVKKNAPELTFEVTHEGEDWEGFKKDVAASNIAEKNQILNVVNSQSTETEKEQKIREMTDIYNELVDIILPPLRRAEISLICNKNNFNDQQISELMKSNPDTLSTNEKLYAASMEQDLNKKKEFYATTIEKDENDWRAYNNLAILQINDYLADGNSSNLDNAMKSLQKADAISPNNGIILNNKAICEFLQGDQNAAMQDFEASSKASVNPINQDYNLAMNNIKAGDYAAAAKDMNNKSCDFNMALIQMLQRDYNNAQKTIDCIADKDARTYYLAAVIGARTQNDNAVYSNLRECVKMDATFKAKAKKDAEFKKYKNRPDFKDIVR